MSPDNPPDVVPVEGAEEAAPTVVGTSSRREAPAAEARPTPELSEVTGPVPEGSTTPGAPDPAPAGDSPPEAVAAPSDEAQVESPSASESVDEAAEHDDGREEDVSEEDAEVVPLEAPHGRPSSVNVVLIPLSLIADDGTFQLRDDPDVAGLATSIARVGQYVPIDVRPHAGRMQVISGFRRLAAVRLLHREEVLARVHEGMTDADALVLALAQGLEQRGLSPEQIHALRDRLEVQESLTAQARGLIEAALVTPGSDLEPEAGSDASDEVDLDELAGDLEKRLSAISADLSAVTDYWDEMEDSPRTALLDQLRYYAELHAFYSRRR